MRYIDKCKCVESYDPEHQYTFTGPCVVTGEDYSVTVRGENLFRFRQSDDLNDLGISLDDREFVISGTSPRGWDKLFGGLEIVED